ncbi:hypothetical protein NL50_09305 [Clostridium acetobutylicum]|nr:hypothetical protein NL50_09305 [Clostridium acetobutylicum]
MKKFHIAALTVGFMLLMSNTAFASTITNEVEPNNSIGQAQVIQSNNEDPSLVVNGNRAGENVVLGSNSSISDEDWYKVNLKANSKTILGINSDAILLFQVYDSNLNPVQTVSYDKDGNFGATAYYVNVKANGDYYIKVTATLNPGEYRFYIGGPDYDLGEYTYDNTRPLTLTSSQTSVEDEYDLRNIDSIPDGATVYNISMEGTKSGSVRDEKRSLKIDGDYDWIDAQEYSNIADVPVSENKLVKSDWIFKLEGSLYRYTNYYTLTPQIIFRYIYPILPR